MSERAATLEQPSAAECLLLSFIMRLARVSPSRVTTDWRSKAPKCWNVSRTASGARAFRFALVTKVSRILLKVSLAEFKQFQMKCICYGCTWLWIFTAGNCQICHDRKSLQWPNFRTPPRIDWTISAFKYQKWICDGTQHNLQWTLFEMTLWQFFRKLSKI